jgi:hypothetical protein
MPTITDPLEQLQLLAFFPNKPSAHELWQSCQK